MPRLILIVKREVLSDIEDAFDSLEEPLRVVTANTLPNVDGPEGVKVLVQIVELMSKNADPLTIDGLSSYARALRRKRPLDWAKIWADSLAEAYRKIFLENPNLPTPENTGVWPFVGGGGYWRQASKQPWD